MNHELSSNAHKRNQAILEKLGELPKEKLLDVPYIRENIKEAKDLDPGHLTRMRKLAAAGVKMSNFDQVTIDKEARNLPRLVSVIIEGKTHKHVNKKSYKRAPKKARLMSTKEKVKRFKMGDTASIRFERLNHRLASPDFPVAARPAPTELRALIETVVAMAKKWEADEIHLVGILGPQPVASTSMRQTISFGIAPPTVDADTKKRC